MCEEYVSDMEAIGYDHVEETVGYEHTVEVMSALLEAMRHDIPQKTCNHSCADTIMTSDYNY